MKYLRLIPLFVVAACNASPSASTDETRLRAIETRIAEAWAKADDAQTRAQELELELAYLQELTAHLELAENGDLILRNTNFQIVSNAPGTGNLILGENKVRRGGFYCDGGTLNGQTCQSDGDCIDASCFIEDVSVRTGSHNIVVGDHNSYAGNNNVIVGDTIEVKGLHTLAVGRDFDAGDISGAGSSVASCIASQNVCTVTTED